MPVKLGLFLLVAATWLSACASAPKFEGSVAGHRSKPGDETGQLLQQWEKYPAYKPLGFKAFAIAGDGAGGFASGMGYRSNSVTVGANFALKSRNRRGREISLDTDCVIFARGERIVLESYPPN